MKLSIIFRILWRYVVGSLSLLPSSSPLSSRFTYSNTPANLPSSIFTMINMVNQLLSSLKYADIDTMNSKATMTLSTLVIAAVALLFASGPIAGNQQALAYVYHHGHVVVVHHPYYGHHVVVVHHPYYGHVVFAHHRSGHVVHY